MLNEQQLATLNDEDRLRYDQIEDDEERASFEYFMGLAHGTSKDVVVTNEEIQVYRDTTDSISLKSVCELIGFIPHAGQQPIVYDFDINKDIHNCYVFAAGRRFGKIMDLNTVILTPNGGITARDISPGDTILDPRGTTQEVTHVHPIEDTPEYVVTLSDGRSISVGPLHEFTVTDHHNKERDLEVQYLERYYEEGSTTRHKKFPNTVEYKFKVDLPTPYYKPEAILPIDPYVLGLLLGDGSIIDNPKLGMQDLVAVQYAADRYAGSTRIREAKEGYYEVSLGILKGPLKALDLLGTYSDTKFIPEVYMNGSIEQRLAVLQGLLDTDGYTKRYHIEYVSVSKRLANDVERLVRSLGGYVTRAEKLPTYTYKGEKLVGKLAYRVYIYMTICPFRLQRKMGAWLPNTRNYLFITDIHKTGKTIPMRCISVSQSHGLYIANEGVVTHNSSIMGIVAIRELLIPFSSTILLAPTFNNAKIIFNEVLKIVRKVGLPIESMNKGQFNFKLTNGARFSANSEANVESSLGSFNSLILTDELQSITNIDKIYKQLLQPTLLDYGVRSSGILYGRFVGGGTSRGTENVLFEYYEKEQDIPNWKSFTAPSMSNPTLPSTYFEQMRLELGDMLYRQEILAEFIGQDDNVFFAFDRELNLYDPDTTTFNTQSLYVTGIDIGWSDSTAQVWVYRERNSYYVHAAYSESNRSTSQHHTSYLEIEETLQGNMDMRYGDPAAAQTLNDYIIDYDYDIVKADNDVAPSIKYINQLFTPTGANHRPRLYINKELTELIRQLTRVRYKQDQSKQAKDPFIKDPNGTHWDLIAAIRYAIYSDKFNMATINILTA